MNSTSTYTRILDNLKFLKSTDFYTLQKLKSNKRKKIS